jgi:hypothetical protein
MVELKLQNRHGGADDAVLHVSLPYLSGGYPPLPKSVQSLPSKNLSLGLPVRLRLSSEARPSDRALILS